MSLRSLVLPAVAVLTAAGAVAGETAKAPATPAVASQPAAAVPVPPAGMHRYMVVRTFPAGALDGLDAAGKKQVNETNARSSVRWVESFANTDKTKTFCIYEGPSEKAIREAAAANKIPVDEVVEISLVLSPK
jgi:hypothetical protein